MYAILYSLIIVLILEIFFLLIFLVDLSNLSLFFFLLSEFLMNGNSTFVLA